MSSQAKLIPFDQFYKPVCPVCSARVIFESALLQDFLQLSSSNSHQPAEGGANEVATPTRKAAAKDKEVQLRVLLPDKTVVTVTINEYWRTHEVYEVSMSSTCILL